MYKILTFFTAFLFTALIPLSAQHTGDELFVIDLKIDNQVTTFQRGPCGFSASLDWGGPIENDFCLPVVWGYGDTDSLGCDSLIHDYTGKMVMLRRGICEFGLKSLNAQKSGAAAVSIANGYGVTHGDDCNAPAVVAGAYGSQVTIPSMVFCRNLTDVIDNALKAGKHPEVCFRRTSLHSPTAEYAYAVPVSQADTMDLISVRYKNQTGVGQEFTAKATIIDPSGTVTELLSSKFIDYPGDSVFYFPEYIPQPLPGKFKVVYTVDQNNQVGDTIYREFVMTPHTFATDNFQITGGATNNQQWLFTKYDAASLFRTGDSGFIARWASFAINNAYQIAIPDVPAANIVNVVLHDADYNDDGVNDLGSGAGAFMGLPFIAYNVYEFDADLKPDSILTLELFPIDSGPIQLEPNHYYYLRIVYDGMVAGTSMPISFTWSQKVNYPFFGDIGPVTPVIFSDVFQPDGWPDATVVARLHEDHLMTDAIKIVPSQHLDATKYRVTPNPANDYLNLHVELKAQNKTVRAALVDFDGRIVASQTLKNFSSGQIHFNTQGLPSGHYGMIIRASEEGSAMVNLMICH